MAANTSPIYTGTPQNWFSTGVLTDKTTTTDLTASTSGVYLIATAGSNGSRFDRAYIQPAGTNVATAFRFWINTGATTTTPANNVQFLDVTLPAATVSQTASNPAVIIELNLVVQASYKLYVTQGTSQAAGNNVMVVGGNY